MKKLIFCISAIIVQLTFFQLSAQTPAIQWWYDVHDASFGQSAAGDIDGDGKLEVVFGCYRNDSCVYALNAEDGSLLWKYNTHPNGAEGCNDVAPILYDVDGDGNLDVIVPSSCNPKTFCFNGANGAVKWVCNTHGSDSPPTIADIDGDGIPEILHGEFGGWVICINGNNGSVQWEFMVDPESWIQTAPTIVDLNNDGLPEFVVATWNNVHTDSNAIYAYQAQNHSFLWKYKVRDFVYHGTAVADLDDDSFPELVIGCYNDTLYCIHGNTGTTYWKYSVSNGFYMGAPASIGDLDLDGECEVVFSSYYKVGALSSAGSLKWMYSIPGYEQAFRGSALADINQDASLDVVFATDGGKVIALNGYDGSLIWTKNLAAHYGNTNFAFDNAPLIADFDQDDSLEVFIVGGHAEYPAFNLDYGRAYMITAGKGYGPAWMMFQCDPYRQSSLCEVPPIGFHETTQDKSGWVSLYPNPTANKISFRFSAAPNEMYGLTIYNSQGEIVFIDPNILGIEYNLETTRWAHGIYYYQIQKAFSISASGKFIVE